LRKKRIPSPYFLNFIVASEDGSKILKFQLQLKILVKTFLISEKHGMDSVFATGEICIWAFETFRKC
jgi:hypothetical protein